MFIPLNYTDTEVGTGDKFSGCKYIYSKISKKNAPIRKTRPAYAGRAIQQLTGTTPVASENRFFVKRSSLKSRLRA